MDQGSLVSDQIEAGTSLVRRFDAVFPVKVAFWLKGSEDQEWILYIGSDAIDERNSIQAYREALRLARTTPNFDFDSYGVRVVGANDPVARAAIGIQERFPARMATRYRGPQLGGVGIEEVYIYPSPVAVSG